MTIYNRIEEAIRQHEEFLYVGNNITESDVRYTIRWVMRDNPDIFWFVHQYHFDEENGVLSFRYRCSQERSAIIQESIDDVVEHFSPKILTKLRNEFEYDGGGYAVWLFRTGAQDGQGTSEVTSISTEGDGWYTVFFSDMGIKSSCRFQAKIVEGKVFVCDFENGHIE